jgi:hypothetical protein
MNKVSELSVGIRIARAFALKDAKLHIFQHGARKGHALLRWISKLNCSIYGCKLVEWLKALDCEDHVQTMSWFK